MSLKSDKKQEALDTKSWIESIERMNIEYVQIFDNVLDSTQCKKYIKLFNKFHLKKKKSTVFDETGDVVEKGKIGTGPKRRVDLGRKSSYDFYLNPNSKNKQIKNSYSDIQERIGYCIYSYLLNIGYFWLPFMGLTMNNIKDFVPENKIPDMPKHICLESLKLRKYRKNVDGYFMPHWDRGHYSRNRILAVLIYLNDVEYGGETIFPLLKRNIKPKAGRLVVFPAYFTHLHYARASTTDKYLIVSHIEELEIEESINKERKHHGKKF